MREHRRIQELLRDWDRLLEAERHLEENRELASGDDPELAEMAQLELADLEAILPGLTEKIQYSLLPRDATEDRDAIMEIRAGTGGDEAALFAGDLLGMYQRYADSRGWKFELLDASPCDVGGFREVTARVSGEEVFRFLKYESGVHRVQRIPVTEANGKRQTSTCTVAVLPEADEVDFDIDPRDLRIDTYRASGHGGQHINKTDSAVRITHLPTGVVAACQSERSQLQNRARAMQLLRSRLLEQKRTESDAAYAENRRIQVGTGDRSERIRTYNFHEGRVTDHRIGLTLYAIQNIMDGDLDEIIDALKAEEQAAKLRSLT